MGMVTWREVVCSGSTGGKFLRYACKYNYKFQGNYSVTDFIKIIFNFFGQIYVTNVKLLSND